MVAAAVCGHDHSLVSVVLLAGDQGPFRRDLRILVRYGTWKSAGVRGDCRSVSHSARSRRCRDGKRPASRKGTVDAWQQDNR